MPTTGKQDPLQAIPEQRRSLLARLAAEAVDEQMTAIPDMARRQFPGITDKGIAAIGERLRQPAIDQTLRKLAGEDAYFASNAAEEDLAESAGFLAYDVLLGMLPTAIPPAPERRAVLREQATRAVNASIGDIRDWGASYADLELPETDYEHLQAVLPAPAIREVYASLLAEDTAKTISDEELPDEALMLACDSLLELLREAVTALQERTPMPDTWGIPAHKRLIAIAARFPGGCRAVELLPLTTGLWQEAIVTTEGGERRLVRMSFPDQEIYENRPERELAAAPAGWESVEGGTAQEQASPVGRFASWRDGPMFFSGVVVAVAADGRLVVDSDKGTLRYAPTSSVSLS